MKILGLVKELFFLGLKIYQVLQTQILWVIFQWTFTSVIQDHKLLMLM